VPDLGVAADFTSLVNGGCGMGIIFLWANIAKSYRLSVLLQRNLGCGQDF